MIISISHVVAFYSGSGISHVARYLISPSRLHLSNDLKYKPHLLFQAQTPRETGFKLPRMRPALHWLQ